MGAISSMVGVKEYLQHYFENIFKTLNTNDPCFAYCKDKSGPRLVNQKSPQVF